MPAAGASSSGTSTPARTAEVAAELGAVAAGSRDEALGANVVATVTPGREVVFPPGSLRPGQHVSLMGADGPGKAEIAVEELLRARVVVDEWEQSATGGILSAEPRVRLFCDEWDQASHGGDIANAFQAGKIGREDVTQLGDVLTGEARAVSRQTTSPSSTPPGWPFRTSRWRSSSTRGRTSWAWMFRRSTSDRLRITARRMLLSRRTCPRVNSHGLGCNELSDEQREYASHDARILRLVAGPGTGKTRVLTRRVAYLIEEARVEPSQILALTFSRAAARELRERLEVLLGEETGDRPGVYTLHAFALRQLLRHGGAPTLPHPIRIADDYDERWVIEEELSELTNLTVPRGSQRVQEPRQRLGDAHGGGGRVGASASKPTVPGCLATSP